MPQLVNKTCLLCGCKEPMAELLPIYDSLAKYHGQSAHRQCAVLVAETSTGRCMLSNNQLSGEQVFGVSTIPTARWRLKCTHCKYRQGAPIQCSDRKCFIAFHVTCALKQDLFVTVDAVDVVDLATGGTERAIVPKCFCKKHSAS